MVTGHRGYIGSHLTRLLIEEGFTVTGLDCDLYRSSSFGSDPVFVPTMEKDLRDVNVADLEQQDVVLHLAGLSNDPLGDLDPELTDAINARGTAHLAQCAKDAGVGRFVFSSSCSSYGIGGDELLTENSPLRPVTPYAISKIVDINPNRWEKYPPSLPLSIARPNDLGLVQPEIIIVMNAIYKEEVGREMSSIGVEATILALGESFPLLELGASGRDHAKRRLGAT